MDQTKEWSAMVSQQLLEEHELIKSNIHQQNQLLSKLMKEYQEAQMRDLEARHDRCAVLNPVHTADATQRSS